MLSHSLQEVRRIGERLKEVAMEEVPTLVKYAEVVPYLVETSKEFSLTPTPLPNGEGQEWCNLIDYDKDGEKKVLAAALYRFGGMTFDNALKYVKSLKKAERAGLAERLLKHLSRFDEPLRELEYCTYTFDLVMDQGAYAEFKRHRMMTQTPQRLSTRLGYAMPRLITEAGFGSRYEAAMESAAKMYEKLYAMSPDLAQYVVPNGYNRRVLATFNLRSAFHFCRLRSAANAHFSIRRVAQKTYEELARVHPMLTKYIRLSEETWRDVEENYFTDL
jgi:thymidylate synthase ThyX